MKKYLVIALAFLFIFLFSSYNFYSDVKALKHIKVEINDVRVEKLLPDIVLNISIKFINEESREIRGLEGMMDIYVLNEYVGQITFRGVDIAGHSWREVKAPLTLYYSQIAAGILKAIKEMNFNLTIEGAVKARIFFGLLNYETPIMARWE